MFRQSSLERLSSPEEIDQLMHVTGARTWIALAAFLALLGAAIVWCVAGRVATSVFGQGAVVRVGGIRDIVANGSGILTHFDVRAGDRVDVGQRIATVLQPGAAERLEALRREVDQAETARLQSLRIGRAQEQLQTAAIDKRIANAHQQIAALNDQLRIALEQVTVEDGLREKGLATRKQVNDARQQAAALQTELANRQAEINQLESDRFSWENRPEEADRLTAQRVLDLRGQLAALEKQSEIEGEIRSPYAGEVIEIKASSGERVEAQTAILGIQPANTVLEVVAYVPSLRAKEIMPGMEAEISPSIVKREEYGFLRGRVEEVGAFPATRAALMRNFANESLVASLTGANPVTELHVAMLADPATASGYRWSSPKGPPLRLSGGMLCNVQVVTRKQRPLELVVPLVKQQAGLN